MQSGFPMDQVVAVLSPVFMVALALQMFFETVDPLLDRLFETASIKKKRSDADAQPDAREKELLALQAQIRKRSLKGIWLKTFSVIVGIVVSLSLGLRTLIPLGMNSCPAVIDSIITGFCISGGTEGLNSLLKTIGKFKDGQLGKN